MIDHPVTNQIVDMMVEAQKARNNESPAVADQLDQKTTEAVQEAVLRGDIADPQNFHHAVARNLVQRYSPHLPEILGLSNLLAKKAK